jgi:hypothetical protein
MDMTLTWSPEHVGSPTGEGGIIEMKALWKLRRGAQGMLINSGRASVTSFTGDRPNASIQGPIVQLVRQLCLPAQAEPQAQVGSTCAMAAVPLAMRSASHRAAAAAPPPVVVAAASARARRTTDA